MLPNKYIAFVLGIVAFFVIANVILLDFFIVSQRGTILDLQTRIVQISDNIKTLGGLISNQPSVSAGAVVPTQQLVTSCPQSCVTLINARPISNTPTVAPVVQQTTVTKGAGEYFVPLGAGSVLSSEATNANWKTIDGAQATFDAGNYGNIKSAYFETFIHVATTGDVHTRLLDTTTPSIFDSDKSTNQTTSIFLSVPITLTSGSKTYKVQMYSTQSTGTLDQARIRIVVQ